MARHRSRSVEFKPQVAQEYLAGEALHGLAGRHDISRNLVRVWVEKYEAGAFDEDTNAADLLQAYPHARGGSRAGHAVEDALRLRRLHRGLARAGGVAAPHRAGLRLFGRPLAATALPALRAMAAEPGRVARLNANARRFRDRVRAAGLDAGQSGGHAILPVITGSSLRAARLSAALFARGVNVQPSVVPAVPERSARLRFFLSAAHEEAELDAAVAALAETWDYWSGAERVLRRRRYPTQGRLCTTTADIDQSPKPI